MIPVTLVLACWSAAWAQPLTLNLPGIDRAPRQRQAMPPPPNAAEPQGSPSLERIAPHLRRQIVNYTTREASGTIVVDTPGTSLYYVLGGGRAIRYGIGVGREGFTWSGTRFIDRKLEWPDWTPPAEMIARQPYRPRVMAGGPGNPLGARAMYLGGTLYRIHGTNDPSSIGKHVSSGCIRLLNEDVIDLYDRVAMGTKVVVLPDKYHRPLVSAEPEPSASDIETAEAPYYGPSRSFSIRRQRF
jgi:lipoprotein-anchoring transpeptidase ErfK/SrfK